MSDQEDFTIEASGTFTPPPEPDPEPVADESAEQDEKD